MSGLILPGQSAVSPVHETKTTMIGGQEVEYFTKPGLAPSIEVQAGNEHGALVAACGLLGQYGFVVQALIREVVALRQRTEELEEAAEEPGA